MIVVDTNIIGYLYLTSGYSRQAEQALLKDPLWVAPLLWRSELRSVLTLYVRKKLLPLVEAQQVMEEALSLMQGGEYEIASHQVLALAAASTCSAYDCEFVALANDLNIPLVTVDRQVLCRSQSPGFGEGLEAAVVGSLDVVREAAGGQLLRGQVIAQALAANPFVVAAGIRAVAVLQVLGLLTFHRALNSS
jgi:predicted nucleic acid-binding protein